MVFRIAELIVPSLGKSKSIFGLQDLFKQAKLIEEMLLHSDRGLFHKKIIHSLLSRPFDPMLVSGVPIHQETAYCENRPVLSVHGMY